MATKKVIWDTPKEATYHFKVYDYSTGQLIPCWCGCKVFGETEKRYHIQICAALPDHAIGDFMWVRKQFVKFKN
jgi:hypothetical protein